MAGSTLLVSDPVAITPLLLVMLASPSVYWPTVCTPQLAMIPGFSM